MICLSARALLTGTPLAHLEGEILRIDAWDLKDAIYQDLQDLVCHFNCTASKNPTLPWQMPHSIPVHRLWSPAHEVIILLRRKAFGQMEVNCAMSGHGGKIWGCELLPVEQSEMVSGGVH